MLHENNIVTDKKSLRYLQLRFIIKYYVQHSIGTEELKEKIAVRGLHDFEIYFQSPNFELNF